MKASSGNILTGNNALNNTGSGINLWNSTENTLINNVASNNECLDLSAEFQQKHTFQ